MLRQAVKYVCALAGFLVITGVAAPRPAAAQGADFAVGYSFLHDNEASENLTRGIFASLGIGVNDWLAIVGEVASNRKSYDVLGTDVSLKVDFYGAGIRFNGRSGRAKPYGQVLFGAAKGRVSALGLNESGSEFAWQPGAGVDAYFSRSVGLRFGVNGRFIQAEDVTAKEFQVIVGLVFGGGR
jgi:hypothetical protein